VLSSVAPTLHVKRWSLAFGYTGENFTTEEWLSLVEECGGPPAPLPRWLSEWISRKTVENEAILEGYVVSSGEERAILLGGYVLERAGEDRGSRVEVSKPLIGPEYEQLILPEVC
jgi:hypothetical protein